MINSVLIKYKIEVIIQNFLISIYSKLIYTQLPFGNCETQKDTL